jgi:hypothetical protein
MTWAGNGKVSFGILDNHVIALYCTAVPNTAGEFGDNVK